MAVQAGTSSGMRKLPRPDHTEQHVYEQPKPDPSTSLADMAQGDGKLVFPRLVGKL